jgi:hypothetical protein
MFDWADSALMQEVLQSRTKFAIYDPRTGLPTERILTEDQVLQILKLVLQDPTQLEE